MSEAVNHDSSENDEADWRAPTALFVASGYATDCGLRRRLNEDSLINEDPVFAVADGMGGHQSGEVASGTCIRILNHRLAATPGARNLTSADVISALHEADLTIRDRVGGRAGTTVTGALVMDGESGPRWLVFNIGDSRTYLLRGGAMTRISVDHSLVQDLIDEGGITQEQAARHPQRHVVTRALGGGDEDVPDLWEIPMQDGDRLLICSDGLTTEVDETDIQGLLAAVPHPQHAADALVQTALRSGGRDNVSVVVVDATSSEDGFNGELGDDLEQTLPRANSRAMPSVGAGMFLSGQLHTATKGESK